ncbi:MAG: RNA polymerase sigma factor [Gaiellaceae bacterium]
MRAMNPSPAQEDAALFRRAKSDPDAFAELYRAYAPAVYSWFRRHTLADADTAADLTAEVFARAIIGIHRFRGRHVGAGTAWLFTIVHHLAIDYARSQAVEDRARRRLRFRTEAYEPSPAEDVAIRLDGEHDAARIMEAFELLSEGQQEAVQARIVDDLTYREIAARNGSSEQAARLQVMRGLQRLREMLAPAKEGRV